ncbi:hypothetical protein N431DRAFT_471137 [Stipitochalara longipes BDJ]|nr:hypothetical protein N431DRAFT_471137 [Stipitochalara longipes BDJ]
MQERDAIAVIILFVFLIWLIAIIVGLKIVNKWAQKMADTRAAMDAERAEVATTVTVTATETEAD